MKKSKLLQSVFIVVVMGLSLSTTSHALQARVFRDLSIVVPGLELSLYAWEFYLKPITFFPLSTRPHECWELVEGRPQKQTVQAPSLGSDLSIVMPNLLYLGDNYFTRMGYNFSQNVNPQYCWYPDSTFFEVAYSQRGRWGSGTTSVPENRAAGAAQTELDTLINGLNTAAFSFYQQMSAGENNIFFSPYNVLQTLAMVYAGARNETASQMQTVLSYSQPQEQLHDAFNYLNRELEKRSDGECGPFAAEPRCPSGFRLNVANSFWVLRNPSDKPELQRNAFLDNYLDTLAINYGEGVRFLSLTGNSQAEREEISRQINYWVQLFTQGEIQQVIAPEQIDPDVNLMLTSAINFNASWKRPFNRSFTDYKAFKGMDGGATYVNMMDQQNEFRYHKGDDYTAIELMFAGDDLSMLILAPHEGHFRQVEARINAEEVNTILDAMGQEIIIKLLMPRWETASNNDMGDVLRSLGLNDLFTAGVADLSGVNGSRSLSLGLLAHSAVVTVDEDGVRAAAATEAINLEHLTDIPMLEINRPFIYIIRDIGTGVVLFMGRMATP